MQNSADSRHWERSHGRELTQWETEMVEVTEVSMEVTEVSTSIAREVRHGERSHGKEPRHPELGRGTKRRGLWGGGGSVDQ